MAIQLTPISSKYFSEIKNGPLFDQNLGDFGTHLKGSLGERIKAEIDVQISWRYDIVNYDITNTNTITLSSGSFLAQGFSIGGTANITFRGVGGTSETFTIVTISSDGKQMVISGAVLLNGPYGVSTYDTLRGLTPLEGLKYKFNFIGNDETTNFISALDETTLSYKTDGIRTASPSPVISTWDDTILGSQTGSHQVTFVQDVSDGGIINEAGAVVFPLNSIQEFKIEHEFILFPYFLDGELPNLETLVRPERIEAGVSLKHVIDFEFRSTLSNPNTAKTGRLDNVLGQTSYFDENFGDEATQYSIDNVVLTRGGDQVTGIDAITTTNVSFSVLNSDGVTNPFLTTQPAVAYVSFLPELDDYNASASNFETVWIYESLRGLIDAAPNSGTIINNLDIDLISTTQVDVSFDITYTAGQQALIDEGDNYIVSFGVGDDALSTDLSNKSILKVNLSEYLKNSDVAGLMDVTKLEVYTHPMAFTEGVTQGYTGYKGWVQDGIMWDWAFNLDRTLDAVLERFRVRLVALKTTDDTFFTLEDVEYDISGQTITQGPPTTQQIELDDTRGFPLVEGSIFNLKTFTTGTYSAPNQPYTGQTAFKVNWQEWIALPDADTVFYDPSEPNNGLNEKASQYSLKDGYEIRILIDADVSVNGATVTNYIFKSPNATVLDFEEQDGTPITWTSIKETFDTSGANVNQEILTNADTNVKFTFTPDAAPGLASLYWGIIRIEEANQPGVAICELSTLRESKNNNILKPLPGESYSKLSLNVSVLCLECAIDYTKLNPAKKYNVYGRMGANDQDEIPLPVVKVQISGTTIQDDADFFVFQQNEIMASSVLKDNFFNAVEGDYVFKTMTSALLGGDDPYDKAVWGSKVPTPITFAQLAADVAASSDLWVFIEQTDPTFKIEGLIIEFERPAIAQANSLFTVVMPANSIDQDIKIWSDRKYNVIALTVPSLVIDPQIALRTGDTASEDWTEWGPQIALTPLDFNNVLASVVDGDKHCLHVFHNMLDATASHSWTFEIEYVSAGPTEKTKEIFQGEIRPQYRPFGKCAEWGPFPNLDQPYATTDPTDAAFLALLDNFSNSDPWSISFWVLGRDNQSNLGGQDRVCLLNAFAGGLVAADGGPIFQFAFNEPPGDPLYGGMNLTIKGNGAGAGSTQTLWRASYPQAKLMHCVITSDGSNTSAGYNIILNGRKARTDQRTAIDTIPAEPQIPSDNKYYHGRWNATIGDLNKQPEKTERIQAFDKELTGEEVLDLYHNINAARGGGATVSNLFRDWDFSAHAAGVVPELLLTGFDMAIVTGGAQPGNPDFY